jgi:peptidoglycan/xylan/chitin deacetylase (PgdA/CDA1 family)
MQFLRARASRGKRAFYESLATRRLDVNPARPIFSFSFDDVPVSAVRNGVPILQREGIEATFYVSLKWSSPEAAHAGESGGFITADQVRALHDDGHHIACHSYSHYELRAGSTEELVWDCLRNRMELEEATGGAAIDHFAYPKGVTTLAAKRALGRAYKTMRGTYAGINHGASDSNLLRAARIYSSGFDERQIGRLIRSNAAVSGWLIFYTHGVEDPCDVWGTSPEHLSLVIRMCKDTDGEILSVREAYERIVATAH